MLFSGHTNSILITREYYQDYGCNFDLQYYPFDTQMCKMVFAVQGQTDNYVKLARDGIGIEFLGGRFLVEYEIQKETLKILSHNNISQAEVRIVFRRRMEYHVTNTFLQTSILVGVGYMSLYFDVDNFTDRIMVTLTTMVSNCKLLLLICYSRHERVCYTVCLFVCFFFVSLVHLNYYNFGASCDVTLLLTLYFTQTP